MIFNNETQAYATNLMNFFMRKGKKNTVQSLFHWYILTKMHSRKKNLYSLLKVCKTKTSTYLGLLEKRRGKRVNYRVRFLNKAVGERRGLVLVGRSAFFHTKKNPRQFIPALNQELEIWASGKHALKEKYKETHIIAGSYAPKSWLKNKKRKQIVIKKVSKVKPKNLVKIKRKSMFGIEASFLQKKYLLKKAKFFKIRKNLKAKDKLRVSKVRYKLRSKRYLKLKRKL